MRSFGISRQARLVCRSRFVVFVSELQLFYRSQYSPWRQKRIFRVDSLKNRTRPPALVPCFAAPPWAWGSKVQLACFDHRGPDPS
jgi:hypothetical protein